MVRTFNAKTGMLDSGLEFEELGNERFVPIATTSGDRKIYFCTKDRPTQILGLTVNHVSLQAGKLVCNKRQKVNAVSKPVTATILIVGAHEVKTIGQDALECIGDKDRLIKVAPGTRIVVSNATKEFSLNFDRLGQLSVDELAEAA